MWAPLSQFSLCMGAPLYSWLLSMWAPRFQFLLCIWAALSQFLLCMGAPLSQFLLCMGAPLPLFALAMWAPLSQFSLCMGAPLPPFSLSMWAPLSQFSLSMCFSFMLSMLSLKPLNVWTLKTVEDREDLERERERYRSVFADRKWKRVYVSCSNAAISGKAILFYWQLGRRLGCGIGTGNCIYFWFFISICVSLSLFHLFVWTLLFSCLHLCELHCTHFHCLCKPTVSILSVYVSHNILLFTFYVSPLSLFLLFMWAPLSLFSLSM